MKSYKWIAVQLSAGSRANKMFDYNMKLRFTDFVSFEYNCQKLQSEMSKK